MNKDKLNTLTKWLAVKGTTEIFDILKELGFNDVGSVARYLEEYSEEVPK